MLADLDVARHDARPGIPALAEGAAAVGVHPTAQLRTPQPGASHEAAAGDPGARRAGGVHAFGKVDFPECTEPERLLALTRRALAESVQPKVTYDVDSMALGAEAAGLGDQVAVVDTSRTPEWRLKARVVRRVREFGDGVTCRLEVGTVAPADYRTLSVVASDVVALAGDVASMDGQLAATATTTYVQTNVSQRIEELDRLEDESF